MCKGGDDRPGTLQPAPESVGPAPLLVAAAAHIAPSCPHWRSPLAAAMQLSQHRTPETAPAITRALSLELSYKAYFDSVDQQCSRYNLSTTGRPPLAVQQ